MKFLTDENISKLILNRLREFGFDVKDIKEDKNYGMDDLSIMDIAKSECRIILTHDKDFGQILKSPYPKYKGIIILRCRNQNPINVMSVLEKLLFSKFRDLITESIIVASETRITVYRTNV